MRDEILDGRVTMLCGDVRAMLATISENSIDCVVTSPPYWGLRDYGVAGQLGLEPTLGEHIAVMVDVFAAVHRVLKATGTLFLNYGDCYATAPNGRSAADTKAAGNDDRTFRDKPFSTIGPIYDPTTPNVRQSKHPGGTEPQGRIRAGGLLKPKDLCMVPNRLAIALQDWGWWVRSEIIWGKRNGMPDSSGRYRPSTAHEKIFMLTKTGDCFYDSEAVAVRRATSSDTKKPDNWDTGPGGHGTFHRNGREKGEKIDKQRGHFRRHQGFNDRWDQMKRADQVSNGRLLRNYEPAPLEVWPMATFPFPEGHFATFPPELVERAVKAGTSEKGCCAKCGAPWVREVGRDKQPEAYPDRKYDSDNPRFATKRNMGGRYQAQLDANPIKTLGWSPSCACDAEIVPCTILDPFGGSGTTAMVAVALGRTATIIELNPDYCTLARARIEAAFMGKDEGVRHMTKAMGRIDAPGPLFDFAAE